MNSLKISKVKGRAMLYWVGKKPIETVQSYPAQLIETVGAKHPLATPSFEALNKNWSNLLFHGDNKEVLSTLLVNGFRGRVDLIYIDPPFDSGADYVRKVELRGTKEKLTGEEQTLIEQTQYSDIWANDNYLQFMYERLVLLRELLSEEGSIYLHCDWRKSHLLRILLDEVFGSTNFINEVIWENQGSWVETDKKFPNRHNSIFVYGKSPSTIFNRLFEADFSRSVNYQRWSGYIVDDKIYGNNYPSQDSRFDTYLKKFIDENERDPAGNDVIVDFKGEVVGSIWYIKTVDPKSKENTSYPTQKPKELLDRIIKASSNKDSIVLDCFIGSGTTAAAAQELGRRWIGADINKGAIQTTMKRFQSPSVKQNDTSAGILHYRVNNYDFQEMSGLREIIIEKYGIEPVKTDSFFDGIVGDHLVKIAELNKPLARLDLQLVKDELKNRPEEERDILLVGSGIELGVEADLADYNRLRPVNKITAKDIQQDGIIVNDPAEADVTIEKKNKKVKIKIKNYISPTIIKRLDLDRSIFGEYIKDFRSQIDVALIDTNYDGKTFNIVHSDVPEKKQDLVNGEYELDLPQKDSNVAVKIIDMLGEETLIIG